MESLVQRVKKFTSMRGYWSFSMQFVGLIIDDSDLIFLRSGILDRWLCHRRRVFLKELHHGDLTDFGSKLS